MLSYGGVLVVEIKASRIIVTIKRIIGARHRAKVEGYNRKMQRVS